MANNDSPTPFEHPTMEPVDTPYLEMSNWSRTALPWGDKILMCVMRGNPIEEAYSGVPPILGCAPLTMEELHREFEREHTLLNQTEWPGALTQIFERKPQQLPHASITRVVCLGLGSFSTSNIWRPRSRDQLVCLTILVEILNRYHTIPKQHVYVQDPAFINEDIEFLKSLGYTYLPDPDAFQPHKSDYARVRTRARVFYQYPNIRVMPSCLIHWFWTRMGD